MRRDAKYTEVVMRVWAFGDASRGYEVPAIRDESTGVVSGRLLRRYDETREARERYRPHRKARAIW